jgi:hypothetical protein
MTRPRRPRTLDSRVASSTAADPTRLPLVWEDLPCVAAWQSQMPGVPLMWASTRRLLSTIQVAC